MTQPAQPEANAFDSEARTVETELSGDDFIALCGNMGWRLLWQERQANGGWRVKALRITPGQPEAATERANETERTK
jgi:hypothetical protein